MINASLKRGINIAIMAFLASRPFIAFTLIYPSFIRRMWFRSFYSFITLLRANRRLGRLVFWIAFFCLWKIIRLWLGSVAFLGVSSAVGTGFFFWIVIQGLSAFSGTCIGSPAAIFAYVGLLASAVLAFLGCDCFIAFDISFISALTIFIFTINF